MKTKTTLLSLLLVLISLNTTNAQVGIGTTSPDNSAVLELQSTTKGFLPPRMDTDARNNINSPAEGLVIYNTDEKCLQWYDTNGWYDGCSGATYGVITSLDCDNAANNGTLTNGQTAAGVDSEIAYTGGNGQSHSGQVVTSTGVTGLTATLSAGNFANGAGSLTYTITGTPASDGTTSFAINIGGQTCSLTRTVNQAPPQVGDFRDGGVVFYVATTPTDLNGDSTLDQGLVCDVDDQSSAAEWGCYGTSISGADGNGIGSGADNTSAILAGCTTSGIAARLCDEYEGGGYSDWFLPSKEELDLMYQKKEDIDDTATALGNGGSGFANAYYWSSTESNSNRAWAQNFFNGTQYDYGKSYASSRVRAVRAF